jgi:hypothetical protein
LSVRLGDAFGERAHNFLLDTVGNHPGAGPQIRRGLVNPLGCPLSERADLGANLVVRLNEPLGDVRPIHPGRVDDVLRENRRPVRKVRLVHRASSLSDLLGAVLLVEPLREPERMRNAALGKVAERVAPREHLLQALPAFARRSPHELPARTEPAGRRSADRPAHERRSPDLRNWSVRVVSSLSARAGAFVRPESSETFQPANAAGRKTARCEPETDPAGHLSGRREQRPCLFLLVDGDAGLVGDAGRVVSLFAGENRRKAVSRLEC